MDRYDQYRKAAVDCIELADMARDPQSRMVLLKMAQMWARLADQAAKNSRTDLVYEAPDRRDHAGRS